MITTGQITVGTTRVQIDGSSVSDFRLHIHNMDATDTLYIGNEAVTTANGFSLFKQDSVEMQCYAGEQVFAISSKGSHPISFLKQV
jgi:nitrous oxidase accessory protein NosD